MGGLKSKLYQLDGGTPPATSTEKRARVGDLKAQLKRLDGSGRTPLRRGPTPTLESMVAGQRIENEHGPFFLSSNRYNAKYRHGNFQLERLGGCDAMRLARLGGIESNGKFAMEDVLFLDTETTGLAGGSGTVPFMVGVGWFSEGSFQVEQYFMNDPSEETAMLAQLEARAGQFEKVCTYNGKAYDLPLLSTRHMMTFRNDYWKRYANGRHLDLLHPCRRIWKDVYEDCKLKTLETRLLGIEREEDAEGHEIPEIYFQYLRDGDPTRIERVFYHNELDILTLAAIAVYVAEASEAGSELRRNADGRVLANLSRNFLRSGEMESAQACLEESLISNVEGGQQDAQLRALAELATGHKRKKEWDAAEEIWGRMIKIAPEDPNAYIELAKLREHQSSHRNLEKAVAIVKCALGVCDAQREALDHRLERLQQKIERNRSCKKLKPS